MDQLQYQDELKIIQAEQQQRFKSRKESLARKKIDRPTHLQDFQLGLQTATQSATASVVQASETNYELQESMDSLLLENSQLRLKLEELGKKYSEDMRTVKEENLAEKLAEGYQSTAGTYGSTTGTSATQRIIELSKKNRELNAILATEKNKVQHLSKKLKLNQEAKHDSTTSIREAQNTPVSGSTNTLRTLKEQLDQSNMRLVESRNQNQILKQELKMAQKMIVQEVGDVGINTNSLLSGAIGWRGRAQQIINLQNKLSDAKRKLSEAQHSTCISSQTNLACATSSARQKITLDKMEREKKRRFEETQIELESLRKEYSALQHQCQALKARNKTLTSDLKIARSKLNVVSTHTTADNPTQLQMERCHWESERDQLRRDHDATLKELRNCLSKLSHLEAGAIKFVQTVEPNSFGKQNSEGGKVVENTKDSSLQRDVMLKVAMIEKDRLLKLTQSLQQRLDATTSKSIRLDMDLRNQRGNSAKKVSASKKQHADFLSDESLGNKELRIRILVNENAVLKETLELTRHEKMEDMMLLNSTLQDSKLIFLDSIRKLQGHS